VSPVAPLRLSHSFAATPDEVFDAWTNPVVLTRWWVTEPEWSVPNCEVDLRVGGRYLLEMLTTSGELFAVAGEYREIDRPHRLVYTWEWLSGATMHPGHVSVVTVAFVADGARTTVALEHAELASQSSRDGHEKGWCAIFESLQTRIFNKDEPRGRS
jgi:uncharacterized protein YndB with AHSA1/START domain